MINDYKGFLPTNFISFCQSDISYQELCQPNVFFPLSSRLQNCNFRKIYLPSCILNVCSGTLSPFSLSAFSSTLVQCKEVIYLLCKQTPCTCPPSMPGIKPSSPSQIHGHSVVGFCFLFSLSLLCLANSKKEFPVHSVNVEVHGLVFMVLVTVRLWLQFLH